MKTTIAWLRNDLRISDNPALVAAVREGERTFAVYIHETDARLRPIGAAARWWLHQSLSLLAAALAERGIDLKVVAGESAERLLGICREQQAAALFFNRRYGPGERQVDQEVTQALQDADVVVESYAANVLVEPDQIATGQGKPYSVYTPFWNALRQRDVAHPLSRPPAGKALDSPTVDEDYRVPFWADKLAPHNQVGEASAHAALDRFLDERVENYPIGRDIPEREATSRLSAHLRFGEISPRQVWHTALARAHREPSRSDVINRFLSELAWRDFNYHQLFHRPDIAKMAMHGKYDAMPWRKSPQDFLAWTKGLTGIPIVDAGMRQLWETGYMQNRVRMLTASFLTKNLLLDWREGEQWFWDCLIDADEANNPGNWQWIAGSGMDASPFFRIFNPVTQGEKFDRDGGYVRRWVPELADLPDAWIHRPSEAPEKVLEVARVKIGKNYPAPIADLQQSRARALEASRKI